MTIIDQYISTCNRCRDREWACHETVSTNTFDMTVGQAYAHLKTLISEPIPCRCPYCHSFDVRFKNVDDIEDSRPGAWEIHEALMPTIEMNLCYWNEKQNIKESQRESKINVFEKRKILIEEYCSRLSEVKTEDEHTQVLRSISDTVLEWENNG